MKKLEDLEIMKKLLNLKHQKQKESFAKLINEEGRLRSALQQLDEHLAESRISSDTMHKAIGADVVWQAWVGRKKSELNTQLAQVLAVKEQHIAQVRKSYGKVIVANRLHETAIKDLRQEETRSELDHAITQQIFQDY